MGGVSKQKGRQRGVAYDIKCVADAIKAKEAVGQDASFERGLLRSWSKHEGYEGAKEALVDTRKD